MNRWLRLGMILGATLCLLGCGTGGVRQEEVNGAATVVEVPTQEEMIEAIRLLASHEVIDGECITRTGEGSEILLEYFVVARKAAAMAYSDLLELHEAVLRQPISSVDAKMHILNRIIYDVPSDFSYTGANIRDVVFMSITPVSDYEIDYLFPFVQDADGGMCVEDGYYRYLYGSGANAVRSVDEFQFFEDNFPRRDLQPFLSGFDEQEKQAKGGVD